MAVRKHRGPLVPPLGGLVVDGANVIATSRVRPIERLDLVTEWLHAFRPDLPIVVFIDHATAVRCKPAAQAVLRARCEDVTPGRPRYVVCPRHEPADAFLLQHARAHQALVMSNDRYADLEDLRRDTVIVQFALAGDELQVFDEATWFRGRGAARVPMAELRAVPPDA